ncbi:MAG: transcriptional regulator GcvA [Pseudomonadota bacterium]
MADRLPPLTALRAFDAAARHMSFARAAEELNVTPAALSYQIKALEEHLGAPLFRRLNRAVELTEAGRALQPGAAEGFDALRLAWSAARRVLDETTLTITAGPAFTAKWLAPRMFGFAQAHPDIELRFAASLKVMDFVRDEVDIAIRFGLGHDEGLFSQRLLEEWITPMMVPELAAKARAPADLLSLPLIHDDSFDFLPEPPNWARWFTAAGLPPGPYPGPHFSQADHAIDVALEGGGVVLGRASLCQRDLARGRLVAPFALSLTTAAQYRFLCRAGAETRPAIARFRAWMESEFEATRALAPGREFVAVEEIG